MAKVLPQWSREIHSRAQAPVQTRLACYSSSKKARDILGQRRSTIDLRETIREGGVLLVSTAQGAVGQDISALVGASLLNLVDAVIREQGQLPRTQDADMEEVSDQEARDAVPRRPTHRLRSPSESLRRPSAPCWTPSGRGCAAREKQTVDGRTVSLVRTTRYSTNYRKLNEALDPEVRVDIVTESESEYVRVS